MACQYYHRVSLNDLKLKLHWDSVPSSDFCRHLHLQDQTYTPSPEYTREVLKKITIKLLPRMRFASIHHCAFVGYQVNFLSFNSRNFKFWIFFLFLAFFPFFPFFSLINNPFGHSLYKSTFKFYTLI